MRRQRASLVIILATGLFAGVPGWVADASARSGVQITINGQPGPRLSFETLTENQGPRQLTTTRDSAGGRSKQSVGGTPAATLVQLIGFNPSSVEQLEVLRPSGSGSVLIDADEIVDGFDGDPRGTRFATFDTSLGNRVVFFRPLRSDGLSSERVTGPIGKDLRVNMSTGAPALNVTSSADKTKSSAGADVRFRSSADGDGRHFYFWDFGDGSVGDGPNPAHTFAAPGTYDVVVTVTIPNGSSGVALPLRIRVGEARTGGRATTPNPDATAPGGGSGGSGTGGGQQSSGGGSGGAGAPSSGPDEGKQGAGEPSGTPAQRRKADEEKAAAKAKVGRPPGPQDRLEGPLRPGTSAVRGTLVADSSAVPSEALAAAEALARLPDPNRTPARAAAGSDSSPLGWAASGGLLLGLLIAGAMREGLRPSPRVLLPS